MGQSEGANPDDALSPLYSTTHTPHPLRSQRGPVADGTGLSAAITTLPTGIQTPVTRRNRVSPHTTEADYNPVGRTANLHSSENPRIETPTLEVEGRGQMEGKRSRSGSALHQGKPARGVSPTARGSRGNDRSGRSDMCIREVVRDHRQWMREHTVDRARELLSSNLPSLLAFECATGGCLDSLALAFAGFHHLGGSEDVKHTLGLFKSKLFEDLTLAPCLGDARDWKEWIHKLPHDLDYYKAGMPCPDYTSLGSKEGIAGKKGGDLFVLQIAIILYLLPKVVRLEIVPFCLEINDGFEFKHVVDELSAHYKVYSKVVECWRYGDATARKRLFIIGVRNDLNVTWTWPDPTHDESWYLTARDIAVPDSEVHPYYLRHDSPVPCDRYSVPPAGTVQTIGWAEQSERTKERCGRAFSAVIPNRNRERKPAGSSSLPYRIDGWDGTLATQLSTNGCSRRPLLSWEPGEPLTPTRMTVPAETLAGASVHSDSYLKLARKHYRRSLGMHFDQWLRELINLGVPLRTGTAIDTQVRELLYAAGARPRDELAPMQKCLAMLKVNSKTELWDNNHSAESDLRDNPNALLSEHKLLAEFDSAIRLTDAVTSGELTLSVGDSGASDHLESVDVNPYLINPRRSSTQYATAGGSFIYGDQTGELELYVLNTDRNPRADLWTPHTVTVTTVPKMGDKLFSLEAVYRDQGFDVMMSHGYKGLDGYTGMYRPPESVQKATLGKVFGPERFIPMAYNLFGTGGWRVPYVIRNPNVSQADHEALLRSIMDQARVDNSAKAKRGLQLHTYTLQQAKALIKTLWAYPAVEQITSVRVPGERDIRPTYTYGGLRRFKQKNWHEYHSSMCHMGEPGKPCTICAMYKGAARPIPNARKGKPRDKRPGHMWHMDMIVFRHRSEEGNKYLIVLTDECTQFYQLIPLYWKSDAPHEIERWIKSLRGHPAFTGFDQYQIIGMIYTDNEKVWDEFAVVFQEMVHRVDHLVIEYTEPGEKKKNPRAEGANRIVEAGICSLIYEKNLPPSWWERASRSVQFLGNRFPPVSLEAAVPVDGDMPSPIERLFQGYYSRHQVYRELDSFIAVGNLALCNIPGAQANAQEARVRWGVSIGHSGKVTRWMCPFTKSRYKSRSYTAFELRSGLNWSQFLGLGDIAPSAQSQMLPQDEGEGWTTFINGDGKQFELPDQRQHTLKELPPPVREISQHLDDGRIIKAEVTADRDGLEFFPTIKKRREPPSTEGDDPMSIDCGHNHSDDESHDLGTPLQHEHGIAPISDDDLDTDNNAPLEGYEVDDTIPLPLEPEPSMERDPELRSRKPPLTRGKPKGKRRGQKRSSPDSRPSGTKLHSQGSEWLSLDDDLTVYPYLGMSDKDLATLEEADARDVKDHTIITDGKHSFSRACRDLHKIHHNLPFEQHNLYRLWLLTKPIRSGEMQLYVEDLPKDVCLQRIPLKQGLILPYPSGPHWHRLLSEGSEYRARFEAQLSADDIAEEQAHLAMREYIRINHKSVPFFAHAARALLSEQSTMAEFDSIINSFVDEDITSLNLADHVALKVRKLKGRNTISTQGDPEPKSMVEALMGDRAEEWVTSIYKEWKGLEDQGVFSHNWTRADLKAAGIHGKPVPCSIALTHKYRDGVLEKLKTRICIAGHKGNVTKGIHYNDVFSASPVQFTERLLQAMRVNLHLENLTWDVKQAYTWAPLPPGERIAVVYPDGFKKRDERTGEELFLVLEKNLYGMPNAARGWSKHRDAFIMKAFNEGKWHCEQSVMDPCLFIIDAIDEKRAAVSQPEGPSGQEGSPADNSESESPSGQEDEDNQPGDDCETDPYLADNVVRSWVLIHTDDCDAYGQDLEVLREINDIMNEEWQTEIVSSDFVLGVRRTVDRSPDGWSCTLTMTSFINDLVKVFEEPLKAAFNRRVPSCPFPEGLILSKSTPPEPGEVERNIDRGYQRLVGSLLWVVRHVCPICVYGCSQLCKLMATPTDVAWHAALHMLNYLKHNAEEGIVFTETDDLMSAFVDASNKDDPADGKTQYGYVIHWGGPLTVKSGKLNHVGINSTYNEYMALHHCIKQIVWYRQLMEEIGLSDYCSAPTKVYADNKQANNICSEDLVTAGNMYFRTGYHYNKEAVRDGYAEVVYCNTDDNIADATTKALGPAKVRVFKPQLTGHSTPLIL